MKISNYFKLGSKLVSSTVTAAPVSFEQTAEGRRGYDLKLSVGHYDGILFPVIFKQISGKKFQDLLDTGFAHLFLISDHMKVVLEENRLTGWKCFSIKLLDKKNNEIGGYHGFSVTGKCGPVDFSKSEIIRKRLVPEGPITEFYKGFYVGLDEWDGSDFFVPQGSFGAYVTARAAQVIRNNKLTNLYLRNLADVEISRKIVDRVISEQL